MAETTEHDCICGYFYGIEHRILGTDTKVDNEGDSKNVESHKPLDASFVHLPPSLLLVHPSEEQACVGAIKLPGDLRHISSSFEDYFHHLELLEKAAVSNNPPELCFECVQRVQSSLEVECLRLYKETEAYEQVVRELEARQRGWDRALKLASASRVGRGDCVDDSIDLQASEESLRNEICSLQRACEQKDKELRTLLELEKEQLEEHEELEQTEMELADERNSLSLEARAFDNEQDQLQKALTTIEDELECLRSPHLRMPSLLIRLEVDRERGLRYPLINDLRLAYRPKGDVQWEEVQVAWSLAAKLLLMCATLFKFQSKSWKIVPLSRGAKVIFTPPEDPTIVVDAAGGKSPRTIVYNLGHTKANTSKTLLAWNALLHLVIRHAESTMKQLCQDGILHASEVQPVPFEISSSRVGNMVLAKLEETDNASWSRAIHYMSSDLLWLSESAAMMIRNQSLLLSSLQ